MLTPQQRQILNVENTWPENNSSKRNHIRNELGLSATRYHQLLDALLQNPDALEAEPMLIHRLQRAQEQKKTLREQRRLR